MEECERSKGSRSDDEVKKTLCGNKWFLSSLCFFEGRCELTMSIRMGSMGRLVLAQLWLKDNIQKGGKLV